MRSAVQTPPLTKYPPTKVSSSTWVRNTEDSNCSQKALSNCAVSTVRPASFVALSDHNDATESPLRELLVGDTFQDRRQPGAPTDQQLPCPQVTLLTTARYQTVSLGTLLSQNGTSRCSSSFTGPPQWHSRDEWSLDTPRHVQKAWKEPRVVTSFGQCCAAAVVACSLLRSRKMSTGTRN